MPDEVRGKPDEGREEPGEIEYNDLRFDLRYSDGLAEELARLASESRVSRAEVIRRWLREKRAERNMVTRKERARASQDDQRGL